MMGRININCSSDNESTSVSDKFIDEYMTDANDAQIKVYLYLLRMMQAGLSTSVSEIADKFNHTEKDISRALRYWEKQGLIGLEYDSSRHLTGIHMEDIPSDTVDTDSSAGVQMSESSSDNKIISSSNTMPGIASIIADNSSSEHTASFVSSKPVYSAEALLKFKNDEHCSQLLYIAEQYFGRPLNTNEMRTILFIHDELKFSDDLLDYLIQYCIEHGKKDFRYMEKVAISWDREGITSLSQAKSVSHKYDNRIYSVMKSLGMDNSPTDTEVDYIMKWINEYGFDMDIISEACSRTVLQTQKNRLKYADGILRKWHDSNVKDQSDIIKLDSDHSKASSKSVNAKSSNSKRKATFPQNSYDFDALERKLLKN